MYQADQTPTRSSRTQRKPAGPDALAALLGELNIRPPGEAEYRLVSRWAAKHVWRIDVGGEPWAFVRYLLGAGDQYPDRWRHLRLGELLNSIRVGPRVLGMTASSAALDGRAAIVEAALKPIDRDELEKRIPEALSLFQRLHSSSDLKLALAADLQETERERLKPFKRYFEETRERWFEAVVPRWLEVELGEINEVREIVSELINRVEAIDCCPPNNGIVPAHNDPNQGNFMLNRQGALRMIDFEDMALNHPVADIGVFLTWFVDKDQHREMLAHYPLVDPDDMLDWMRLWVPLRYLNIAAHWAARLTQAHDEDEWEFAVESVEEWLRGAAELVEEGEAPKEIDDMLEDVVDRLMTEWPRFEKRWDEE